MKQRKPLRRFIVNIFYSEEDEGYIEELPDLEHCTAFDDIAEEALQEDIRTKEMWLEAERANRKPIPLTGFFIKSLTNK